MHRTAETEGTGRTINQPDTKEWANPREEVIFKLVLQRKVKDIIWVATLMKERLVWPTILQPFFSMKTLPITTMWASLNRKK